MEEAAEAIKKFAKRIGKSFAKRVLPPIIAVLLVVIIISGSTYVVMKWIAKKVAEATSPYTSSINISDDGTVTTDVSAQELWENMIKQGYDVDKYLDTPEELAKLLNAEIVTQLPDMRKDVTKDIDWDDVLDKMFSDKKSDEDTGDVLQGVIKFKRHDENGKEYYLTYAKPDEFQNQIEIYQKSGSEKAKDFVMSHFTLKKSPKAATSGIINGTGSFTKYNLSESQLSDLSRICLREQGDAKGAAAEASLMANLFELAGSSFGEGADGLYNYVMNSGWFGIPGIHNAPSSAPSDVVDAVKAVLIQGYRTLPKYVNEHDCINPPDIINPPARREDFIPFQTVLHNIYGSTYTFYSFPTETSDPFGYTSEDNRQKYGDFCYEYGSWQPINGTEDKTLNDIKATETTSSTTTTLSSNMLHWPLPNNTQISSYFGPRNTGIVGASTNHRGIDIPANDGTKIEAAEAGKAVENNWNDASGWYILLDHGNNIYTKYQHMNSQSPIKVGENVNKGQVIGYVGNTGVGSGSHLHFAIQIGGTTYGEYEVDPLKYKYDNGIGNGTESLEISSATTTSSNGGMDLAKLALEYSCTASGCTYPGLNDELSKYGAHFDGSRINLGKKDVHKRVEVSATQKMLEIHDAMAEKFPPLKNGWYASCSPYVAAMVTYLDIDPDMYNKVGNSIIQSETQDIYYPTSSYFEQIELDTSKTYAEQCQPGDILSYHVGNGGHVMVYVGNELAQQYFPGTNGGMVEAAERGGCYPGVTTTDQKKPGSSWHCFRPIGGGSSGYENSETFGYQAVIGTWKQVDKSTDAKGPNLEDAAEALGVTIEDGTTYSITTKTINYERLVQPYTLQFDLLWALLVLGQSKNFVMDLADLAYGSDIEVSVYDNLTTTNDYNNWNYAEAKDGRFSGKVSYTVSGGSTHTSDIEEHEHLYENNDALSEESGYINKTVVTQDNTVTVNLSKADTWIADFEANFEKQPPQTSTSTDSISYDDQLISDWADAEYSEDKCDEISDKIEEVVESANSEIESINAERIATEVGNSTASGTGGSVSSPTSSLSGIGGKLALDEEKIFGSPESNANLLSKISADDVDTSKIKAETRLSRVGIVDNATTTIVTQKYIEKEKKAIIKDDKKTEPNFVTLFNSYKYRQNRNNILSATEWLFEIMEENEKLVSKLDIMKYLLYKATDVSYGVTEFDEELFYPGALNDVGDNIGANGDFLTVAEKLWKEKIWHSGKTYGGSSVPCTGGTIDCSSFVSWVLYEYGYKEFGGGQTVTQIFYLTNWNAKYGWKEFNLAGGENPISYLQPGDLIVRDPGNNNGHITLVAKIEGDKILCYDCGNSLNWQSRSVNGEPIDKSYMLTDNRTGKVIRVTPPK